ncbi:MAG: DUF2066 domain-containing protein [Gammaproteobacteria bacterium]|nr:DUF2066 domain-containing protein [Gammaproteobacteria bacterium]
MMKTSQSVVNAIRSITAASLLLLLLVDIPEADAVVVKGLYDVEYPVPDQSRTVRTAVFNKGLEEVLIRVSGDRSVLKNLVPGSASAYVQQFSYVDEEDDESAATGARSASKKSGTEWYTLKIQYNAGKIISLLRENGMPVWGEHRSVAIVWLAVRDGSNRYVLKKSDTSLLKDSVDLAASRRGVPVVWPVYDSKDRQKLAFADVWAAFSDQVKAASRRYTKGPSMVGRLSWTGSEWKGDWSVFIDNAAYGWSLSGSDYNTLISQGVDLSADMIGKHYAVLERTGITGPGLLVEINNVNSLQDYRKIQTFLQDLTAVRHVHISRVDQGKVAFTIDLRGNIDDFKRLVSTDKRLEPVIDSIPPVADATRQNVLRYNYRR